VAGPAPRARQWRELVPCALLGDGVVRFSDPRRTATGELVFPGHIGTIYQASSAAYLGLTAPCRLLLLPDGCVLSERALSISCGVGARTAPIHAQLLNCASCMVGLVTG
jgi:hypothetical protein